MKGARIPAGSRRLELSDAFGTVAGVAQRR
jgi:hypothetical protein